MEYTHCSHKCAELSKGVLSCKQRRAIEPNPFDMHVAHSSYSLAKTPLPQTVISGLLPEVFEDCCFHKCGNERKLLYIGLSAGTLEFCVSLQIETSVFNETVYMIVIFSKCACFCINIQCLLFYVFMYWFQ